LDVRIDNQPVNASGTITMNGNHNLNVTADEADTFTQTD
jgi:hypothetical protein